MNQQPSVIFGLCQIAVVVAGVCFGGLVGHPGDPPNVFTLFGYLSLALFAIGAIVGLTAESTQVRMRGFGGAMALGLYVLLVMGYEPFLDFSPDMFGVLTLVLWLVPLLVGGIIFARFRCWVQAAATSVFLFACVALLTFNLERGMAGFVCRIRS